MKTFLQRQRKWIEKILIRCGIRQRTQCERKSPEEEGPQRFKGNFFMVRKTLSLGVRWSTDGVGSCNQLVYTRVSWGLEWQLWLVVACRQVSVRSNRLQAQHHGRHEGQRAAPLVSTLRKIRCPGKRFRTLKDSCIIPIKQRAMKNNGDSWALFWKAKSRAARKLKKCGCS